MFTAVAKRDPMIAAKHDALANTRTLALTNSAIMLPPVATEIAPAEDAADRNVCDPKYEAMVLGT